MEGCPRSSLQKVPFQRYWLQEVRHYKLVLPQLVSCVEGVQLSISCLSLRKKGRCSFPINVTFNFLSKAKCGFRIVDFTNENCFDSQEKQNPLSRKAISRSQSKEQHLLGNKYNAVSSNWTVVA